MMNPLERFKRWVERQRAMGRPERPEYECPACGRRVRESSRDVHDEICPEWLEGE